MKRTRIWQFLGLAVLAAVAHADVFPLYDDPFSIPTFGARTTSGNVLSWQIGAKNTGTVAHDVGVAVTQLNTDVGGVAGNLVWNQALGGWAGTYGGNSLLVTVTNPTGHLPWSDVANAAGSAQDSFSYFGQPTDPTADYPFFDFGSLAPGASSPFVTFDFLFTWGGTGTGTVAEGIGAASVAPIPGAVPDPTSVVLLFTLAIPFAVVARRRVSKRLDPVRSRL